MQIKQVADWKAFRDDPGKIQSVVGGAKTGDITYYSATGWHFYSMLKVRLDLQKGDSARDAQRLVRLYKNYTRAAVKAEAVCRKTCVMLEHQGNVIHFFFPDTTRVEFEIVRKFAKDLAALVDEYVMGYYDADVLQFHLATEYGRSVIVRAISPELGDWSDSTVSLGPSANNPAKKMGDSVEGVLRPLWWRENPQQEWRVVDVKAEVRERSEIVSRYSRVLERDSFDAIVAAGVAMPTEMMEASVDSPSNKGKIIRRTGFFFRADMDGFTHRVEEAFNGGRIQQLVEEFVAYMAAANRWEAMTEMSVVVHPWAGDCYNSLIVAKVPERFVGMELAMKSYPKAIVKSWSETVTKTSYRTMKWVYALSGGEVFTFGVTVNERSFKLSVGGAVGKTLAAVNFEDNKGGYLVMQKDEAEQTGMKFRSYPTGRHPSFRINEEEEREKSAVRAINSAKAKAGATILGGMSLAATKPWGGE